MEFLEICQNISDQLDGDDIGTVVGDVSQSVRRLRENVNRGYNTIWLALGKQNESRETSTSFSTSANTESYNIPSGILSVDQLKYGTDLPIKIIPWPEYERYKADLWAETFTGYPDVASIYQRKIWLYPTPDEAFTIQVRGQQSFAEMVNDDDSPDLESDFHRVIQEMALYFEMDYEGNPRAGTLIVSESGGLSAQGGQAAVAVNMFKLVRQNQRAHYEEPARRIGPDEMRRYSQNRRITRS